MTTDRDALGYHAAVSMIAGITGAVLIDRVVAFVLAVIGSLVVIFISELFKPWLQRRARRLAGETIPPPRMP
jgi:ABC-type uncharacterized transport system permease subunit